MRKVTCFVLALFVLGITGCELITPEEKAQQQANERAHKIRSATSYLTGFNVVAWVLVEDKVVRIGVSQLATSEQIEAMCRGAAFNGQKSIEGLRVDAIIYPKDNKDTVYMQCGASNGKVQDVYDLLNE